MPHLPERKRSLLAAALLLASVFFVVVRVSNPARFEVAVTVGGQVVITAVPQVYSLLDVLSVAVVGIVAGAAAGYLVQTRGEAPGPEGGRDGAALPASADAEPPSADVTRLVARLLEGEARTVYLAMLRHGGDMLQRELVLETNLPKATVSRTLTRLAERGLIVRTPMGLTNRLMAVRTLEELDAR